MSMNMITDCNFSLKHYCDVLKYANEKYLFQTFSEFINSENQNNVILLRHDVDYSLEKAFEMAKLEHDLNIKSTFFILLNSDFYNPSSPKNLKFLKKILEFDHEIGLHYDSDNILDCKDPQKKLEEEISYLENLTDTKISVIFQHNPTISSKISLSNEFIDVRESQFFNKIPYISDSVQNWRSGCMCNHVKNEKIIQILVHPIWWTDVPKSRYEILDELVSSLSENISEIKNIHQKYLQDLKK